MRSAGPSSTDSSEEEAPAGFTPKSVAFSDILSLWVTNIAQTYGDAPSTDNAPVAAGVLDDLVGRPLFLALYDYFRKVGSVYKLAFGPKTFMIVSDPVVAKARHPATQLHAGCESARSRYLLRCTAAHLAHRQPVVRQGGAG